MQIIEYEDRFLDDVKNLLVELEEYIIKIDEDGLDQLHSEYKDKMALLDLKTIKDNSGKCYLAIQNNMVIGLIMGYVRVYDEFDYLDYKCPKSGVISEFIVSEKVRSKGIGKQLINKLEEYFKSINCEYILLECFAYNKSAINFYKNQEYHTRMLVNIKKL